MNTTSILADNVSNPTNAEIAARAHQIFLASGSHPGHDLDNWLQAEYELRKLPVRVLATLKPTRKTLKPSLIRVVQALF